MANFQILATSNKRVRALHKALDNGSYSIDIEGIEKEIDQLHLTRKIRTLKTQEVISAFQAKFIEAALQNQAYRSRLVELKVKCFRVSAKLEEHIGVIRSYLATEYPNALKKYRTVKERRSAIDSVLERPIAFLNKLELKDKELETVIKDLDQCSFSLKHIIDAMAFNTDKTTKF